jgi:hypothetical protein
MSKYLFTIILAIIQVITSAQTITTLRGDGVMLKNGQPFFPIGYYAESFNTLAANNYAANTLANAGFNVMFTEHDIAITPTEFGFFLDNCATKGIYNIISFWDPSPAIDEKMNSFIPMFKNKPSVVVWAIADDASTLGTEADILRKHNLAVSLDPNHLTSESFNGPIRDIAVATVGQSGKQAYPKFLPTDLMDGYDTWPGFVELVTKCNANGKTPIAHLQTYKWTTGNFIYPSASECDVQSYLAVIAGMKGIEYYTFKDGQGSTINLTQTSLWNAAVNVATEINGTLKDILLNGTRTTTANTVDHVYYSKWVYNNDTYIIAVNVDQIAHDVSIPVSGTILTNVFSYRPSLLSLNSNILSGTLSPLQTQIYKVTNTVLSNVTFSGAFNVTARHSGLALHVQQGATTNGTPIQQYSLNNTDAQIWLIEATGNGYYKLTAKCSNKVLSVKGLSTENGEIVHQWHYVNSDDQQWKIEDLHNGYYKLTAKHSNKALTVSAASTDIGASVVQWPWTGGYNQQWSITKQSPRINNSNATLYIHPNPAEGTAYLNYYKKEAGPGMLRISNVQGKVVSQKQLSLQKGNNTVALNLSNLPQGVYMVNIFLPSMKKLESIKLIVK